jgi:hypothetical protein
VARPWWWQTIFDFFLAFWTAFFEAQRQASEATREVPDATARDARDRLRDAVLRAQAAGGAGHDGAAPARPAGAPGGVVRDG